MHTLSHMVAQLLKQPALNPWNGSCLMDEDYVGKLMRIANSIHVRSLGCKVVEFYSARLTLILERYRKAN